jgi:hypothetical protein
MKMEKEEFDNEKTLCTPMLFRYFFRKNFKEVVASNEEIDEINVGFSKYLREKCNDDQLSHFLLKSDMEVILNADSPLTQSGFHHAFVLHFLQYAELKAKL